MFHRHEKKGVALPVKALKDLTAIAAPEVLLAGEKRASLIKLIREASPFEVERFDSLCLCLIMNVVNHSQNLPETLNSYYSQPGGFVDNALNRTELALQLLSQFLIHPEEDELSEEQKLWHYALFSAAMLQGIGKLQSDFSIKLYDAQGHYLKDYNPLLGSFALVGSHYAYTFQKDPEEDFRKRLNLLLARMLMPASGFSWIASDPQVLSIWLALLNEDHQGAKTFGALLIRANALSLQRYFNQPLLKTTATRSPLYGGAGTFSGGLPASDLEQKLGIEVLQWLTKSLAAGDLVINKHLVMAPEGLAVSAEIFKMFAAGHPNHRSWQVARSAMLALGLHHLAEDGNILSRFENKDTRKTHNAILLADYAVVLPPEVSVLYPDGKIRRISALELVNQAKLLSNHSLQQISTQTALQGINKVGGWEPMPAVAPNSSSSLAMSSKSGG